MSENLLLQGGAEFGGDMRASDLAALARCGGMAAPVRIIPAAAAPDNNHARAGENGMRWFRALGATDVRVVALIDRPSAEARTIADELRHGRLIYLLGGFPAYLAQTLAGSRSWDAIRTAMAKGAVLAGSSAGAMVLCDHYYDPAARRVAPGLGLLPACCVLPHHDTFGEQWAEDLRRRLPRATLVGIDEQTGILGDPISRKWTVYGRGALTRYTPGGGQRSFPAGTTLEM